MPTRLPLVLDSTIPFVLLGSDAKHRSVIAKSGGLTLDLVGLDHFPPHQFESHLASRLAFLFSPNRHVVSSSGSPIYGDGREGAFTFAWRGFANSDDVDGIKRQLTILSTDLGFAVSGYPSDDPDSNRLEWLIGGIMLLCAKADERLRSRRNKIFLSFIIVAVFLTGLATRAILQSYHEQVFVRCVAVHIRENRRNDQKLEDAVQKIIADMGLNSCGLTYEANDRPRHLAVEYTIDSEKMRTEALRLKERVRDVLPEFAAIQADLVRVDDPKYRENVLGLWLTT